MSAGFVNTMRETVISGFHGGEAITPAHRRAILIDWVLCMTATVTVCVLFAGILISYSVESLASEADVDRAWRSRSTPSFARFCS